MYTPLACRTNTADRLTLFSRKSSHKRQLHEGNRFSVTCSGSRNRLNALISSIIEERRTRCSTAGVRCRPRLSSISVSTIDENSKKKTRVDVAYLQDYPDRLKALRELLSIQFRGKLCEVYSKFDYGGTGMISLSDLDEGLKFFGVCWQQVTGLTRAELHELLDPEKSGSIDILDFLSLTEVPTIPDWSTLPLVDQWDDYCAKVSESILLDDSLVPRKTVKVVMKKFSSNPSDCLQMSISKIEDCLREYNENRRGMAKLRSEFQSVTEAEEKRAEQQRNREELEEQNRLMKAEAGRTLLGGGGKSIFKTNNVIRGFQKPTKEDMIGYFSVNNPTLLSRDEMEYRNFLQNLNIPLVEGDRIKRVFGKHFHSCLNETSFNSILKELLPNDVNIQGYWTSFNTNNVHTVLQFIEWFTKNF